MFDSKKTCLTHNKILLKYFRHLSQADDRYAPKKVKPDAGLEPATVGLKVQRSTD